MAILSRDLGVYLQYRTATGGDSGSSQGPPTAGPVRLRLERKGFDPLERKIDVEPGRETPFVIRLVPNARSVVVRTEPDGVRVTVDGTAAGETARPASGPA